MRKYTRNTLSNSCQSSLKMWTPKTTTTRWTRLSQWTTWPSSCSRRGTTPWPKPPPTRFWPWSSQEFSMNYEAVSRTVGGRLLWMLPSPHVLLFSSLLTLIAWWAFSSSVITTGRSKYPSKVTTSPKTAWVQTTSSPRSSTGNSRRSNGSSPRKTTMLIFRRPKTRQPRTSGIRIFQFWIGCPQRSKLWTPL